MGRHRFLASDLPTALPSSSASRLTIFSRQFWSVLRSFRPEILLGDVCDGPAIISAGTLMRQQGSPSSNSTIATVNNGASGPVVVTVSSSNPSNGVTISNIVNNSGTVTADVIADCTATLGDTSFTLTVTDSVMGTATANLTVNVVANSLPTVGTYADTSLITGAGTDVSPTAPPADNGSISTAIANSPGFGGTFAVDTTTGVVTITNASPAGVYPVTVTFTDNCGAQTTRQFTLSVNTPPTITAQAGVSSQQGSPVANLQIAAVTDPDQALNTLAVTVDGGASSTVNGVTVSGDRHRRIG